MLNKTLPFLLMMLFSIQLFAQNESGLQDRPALEIDFSIREYITQQLTKNVLPKDRYKLESFIHSLDGKFNHRLSESVVNNPTIPKNRELTVNDFKEALNYFANELLNSDEFASFTVMEQSEKQDTIMYDGKQFITKSLNEPCDNSDFETGDFTSWELFKGEVTNQPYGYGSVTSANPSDQHFIVSGGFDPTVPNNVLPKLNPNGGSYSVQLGDYATGSKCGIMRQTFLVDANHTSYSYSYALVMEDPSDHTLGEKPFFKVNMYDENDQPLVCGEYEVISGAGGDPDFVYFGMNCITIPFFNITTCDDAYYLPWRTTFIPLDTYIGQNVTIEFVMGDCSQGGHMGYAYLDASCSSVQIDQSAAAICSGDPIVIGAPEGAASYLWSPGGQTTQSITVSQPGTYTVTVTPVSGSGCSIDLTTEITGSTDIPVADFTVQPTAICVGSDVTVTDQSSVIGTSSITDWLWDFDGDGVTDMTGQNPGTYTYDTPGVYNLTLTASANGCNDTHTVQIQVDAGPDASWTAPDSLCYNVGTIDLNNLLTGQTGGTWSGTGVTGSTFNVSSGSQDVTYSIQSNTCDVSVTHNIPVLSPIDIDFSTPQEICLEGTPFTLSAQPEGGTFVSNGQQITEFNPATAGLGNHTITYAIAPASDPACISTVSVTIKVVDGLTVTSNIPDRFCYQADNFVPAFTPAGGTMSGDLVNGNNLEIAAAQPGVYSIHYDYVSAEGCSSDYDKTFVVLPEATINFDYEQACFQTATFVASQGYSHYVWYDGENTMGSGQTYTGQIKPAGAHQITLEALTPEGCKAVATQIVEIEEGVNIGMIQIPNVLTANGDGKNDEILMPLMDQDCFEYKVEILNRWGNVVYTCDKDNPIFRGETKGGVALGAGVYFYRLVTNDFDCSEYPHKAICHGFITIVR